MFSLIFKITMNFKTNTIFTHIYTTVYKKKIFTMVQGCVKIIISLIFPSGDEPLSLTWVFAIPNL